MIDKLFMTEGDNLLFDTETVRSLTDSDFVGHVLSRLRGYYVRGMKVGGDRRLQFVYFTMAAGYDFRLPDKHYSFSYEKKTDTLIFSEQIRKGKRLVWKFVVGWKPI